MAALRSQAIRHLSRSPKFRDISSPFGSSRTYSNPGFSCRTLTYSFKSSSHFQWNVGIEKPLLASMVTELSSFLHDKRSMSTKVKAPPQIRQMGALKVSMVSPGIVYEPYAPREPISFLRRWLTISGWRRTKEDFMMELKNAYAIAKLRKVSGYSKNKFYEEAVQLYKEINIFIANGDKASLRKAVTENMYSALKNEIKQRESKWSSVYWELIVPIVKMRTLRARMIGIDKNDLNKAFVQLTIEFLAKQKFEAYDSKGNVVAGDKSKEQTASKVLEEPICKDKSLISGRKFKELLEEYGVSIAFAAELHYALWYWYVISGYLRDLYSTLEHTGVFVGEYHYRLLISLGMPFLRRHIHFH